MNVQLKLFATFRQYLPTGTVGNALAVELPGGTRVGDLLARFGLSEVDSPVILVNGRGVGHDHVLEEGDVVAAFPSMAGG